jgi:hypothetical protein
MLLHLVRSKPADQTIDDFVVPVVAVRSSRHLILLPDSGNALDLPWGAAT